jgi:apolipoprotein D and lipocalin family protein
LPGTGGAKLKVSFFGPFYVGNYWVLDHAEDYAWSIVGEPSGRYLWILTRDAHPAESMQRMLIRRAGELGFDAARIRLTKHA